MGGLTRETSYLHGDEETALEEMAKKERYSKSEIIRLTLREYLKLGTDGLDGHDNEIE